MWGSMIWASTNQSLASARKVAAASAHIMQSTLSFRFTSITNWVRDLHAASLDGRVSILPNPNAVIAHF